LGFIVSKLGIIIYPKRTKSISQIYFPHNKKNMQSFLGKINFVRTFVHGFTKIVKPLHDMIKNNFAFQWEEKERESFKNIKEAIVQAPTLTSPDFEKEFILYTYAYNVSYAIVLTQKNTEGFEIPTSFMSFGL
jgi:hypothetical protein